nr:aryl-sulfate sulfotransferase [uncultured Faecalibacillus sp.]
MILLTIISLGAFFFSLTNQVSIEASSDDNNSINYVHLKNTSNNLSTIYSTNYQNKIYNQIAKLKKYKNYTIEHPLLITNPYGTNTTSVYMYFKTSDELQATYTIHCERYNDFPRTLNNNTLSGYTTNHEYFLVGAIPGQINMITLTLTNKQGKTVDTLSWSYNAPSLQGGDQYLTVDCDDANTSSLSNGLYTVLGNDVTEDSEEQAYMRLYDNDGILRSEIPIISYRSHRILFEDNTMYFSISSTKIVGMDQTGYISKIYDTGNYKLHHDYIFDDNNNLLVLASEKNAKTSEDKIIMIEKDSGNITELVDLIDLLPNYYSTTSMPDGEEDLDWMHINSLALVDKTSLIISSRETSTIIKLDNIYSNPSIDYMIGSDYFWQESGYDSLLLNKTSDFSMQAGQHCVTYVEDNSLPQGQYYLYLYNNNLAVSTTRPDYDWKNDSNYSNAYYSLKKGTSYYYKYLVNENTRTVELVSSIPVAYSGYVSSVQELDGNVIIDSGIAMSWSEYSQDGTLLKTFKTTGGKFVYRVFKYDYLDYWFQ